MKEPRLAQLSAFDFDNLAAIYEKIGWRWARGNGASYVPNAAQLRKTAELLISHAQKSGKPVSTGGLKARPDGTIEFTPGSYRPEFERLFEKGSKP